MFKNEQFSYEKMGVGNAKQLFYFFPSAIIIIIIFNFILPPPIHHMIKIFYFISNCHLIFSSSNYLISITM